MPSVYRFTQYLYFKFVVSANMRWSDLLIVTTYTNKHRVDRLRGKPASTSFVLYYLLNKASERLKIDDFSEIEEIVHADRSEFAILIVAANTANKNLSGVLAAYHHLWKTDSRWQLTIVTDAAAAVQELAGPLKHRLRVLERLTENELINLYRTSLYYWQLSFVEGFGLPLIEALSENCRIICSDIPIFREILDDAACYVDPMDPSSVSELCQHWPLPEDESRRLAVFERMHRANQGELKRLAEQLSQWQTSRGRIGLPGSL
jgi:glycosyltransferase involved in cell wall biosynthesis